MTEETTQQLPDLWGQSFTEQRPVPEPVRLLEQQAEKLTERTHGRIEGIVRERAPLDGTVGASLWARVPAIRNYEHKLLSFTYAVDFPDLANPYPLTAFNSEGVEVEIKDRVSFVAWLASVLSSPEIHELIARLLWYSSDQFQTSHSHS